MSEKDIGSSEKSDKNINEKAAEEGSLKGYYNALNEADEGDTSLSSLPDFIIDTLINADDDAFAEFLSARTLSKDSKTKDNQNKSRNSSTLRRDTNDIDEPLAKERDDNSLNNNDSSNPPPLVLPPAGAVNYDESFIEMVIRIVNKQRDKNNTNDDDYATNSNPKGKGKERATDISTSLADEDEEEEEEEEESIPRIERARREKPGSVEDSLALDEYSLEEGELLFLADDKIPSFLYNDDVDSTSSVFSKATHRVEKKEANKAESSFSRKTRMPHESSSFIQFDDVLDQSCDSIEAIQLNDEVYMFKQDSADEEDSTDFIKDYSSWLYFDSENNCMNFKVAPTIQMVFYYIYWVH